MIKRALKSFLSAGFLLLCFRLSVFASGSSLTLAWDPSTDPTVVGYRLYQGTVSEMYDTAVDIGSNTSVVISDLVPGATYFFAVTAYDSAGLESGFSGEISYSVPADSPLPVAGAQLAITLSPAGQKLLTGAGPAGAGYEVWASQDLASWSAVGTVQVDGTGSFQFTDDAVSEAAVRFYRLILIPPGAAKTPQRPTARAASPRSP